ncbi:MAG: glycoside hydrolase 43 family protein, partial [Longimicrobiales bacterium]|nr:glycoside hydrolase 43 family protein [Longimicrobiales bacterium]
MRAGPAPARTRARGPRDLLAALLALLLAGPAAGQDHPPTTWVADNGNGTYSNPLFFEEFSDPDVIRVGDEYFLTGTTMHTVPGLPVLRSKDLVNWELASYALERLELDPSFGLEGGEQYGQGIWAPVIRHHDGTFYIFSNVNGFGTQVYRSESPEGPWEHNTIETTLYDLSVLFDDDGTIYAVHRADDGVILEELNEDITAVMPGTRRVLMPRDALGEGYKLYRIDGTYYLISAIPGAHTPLVGAKAPTLDGPWAYDTLAAGAHLGVHTGNALRVRRGVDREPVFEVVERDPNTGGGLTLHQGAIVDTPGGEWWSIIMQDHRSLGRVSALVPVTWQDGWPYLGLAGNLRNPPRLWVKPETGHEQEPAPLFVRDDDFDGGELNPIWQWNHNPVDGKWSVTEEPGVLRLHSLPAPSFWWARNTLTQRAAGPVSTATVAVDAAGMEPGDVAGLALLNRPYAWIGLVRTDTGLVMRQHDQLTGTVTDAPVAGHRFWLRADADYETEVAELTWSSDAVAFERLGDPFTLVYQLVTFQGIRYSLFHFNTREREGGHVDFDD